MLVALHSSWAASPPGNTITNSVIKDNQATSTLRRYPPANIMPSQVQTTRDRIPGPQGPKGPRPVITPPKPARQSGQAVNSAFNVYKTVAQVGNMSDVLTFDSVTTNVGDNFDLTTGVFTCTSPGLYVFSFTIITQDYPIINLCKNQEILATVFRTFDGAGYYDTVGNQAVVQLDQNDQVFLMFLGYDMQEVYGDPYYKYTTFSGYQISS